VLQKQPKTTATSAATHESRNNQQHHNSIIISSNKSSANTYIKVYNVQAYIFLSNNNTFILFFVDQV
jgi:hypothetical protein